MSGAPTKVFSFVVRRLRWLVRVPSFPQLFDSMLLAWTWVAHRSRLQAIETLEKEMLRLPEIKLGVHRFGGMEFVLATSGRELAHVHGHGLLDVRLDRPQALELITAGRVREHHFLPKSGWVSFQIESPADVPFAMELLTMRLSPRQNPL